VNFKRAEKEIEATAANQHLAEYNQYPQSMGSHLLHIITGFAKLSKGQHSPKSFAELANEIFLLFFPLQLTRKLRNQQDRFKKYKIHLITLSFPLLVPQNKYIIILGCC
jgi:hypothetical protein